MGLFTTMNISVTALEANRLRMEAASSNLANSETSAPDDASVYRVQRVLRKEARKPFQDTLGDILKPAGVTSNLFQVARPPRYELDPDHPDADEQGRVRYPEVNIVEEMAEMMAARRAYEVGLTSYAEARSMFVKTLELGV